ncbi:MAG TPA: sigma 54-interacting transcriptional regulator [Acidobacteriaceae bacterium]|nr:sigma 54-interacting transcriptional regulator [Acidobacteriaceae bacterium]
MSVVEITKQATPVLAECPDPMLRRKLFPEQQQVPGLGAMVGTSAVMQHLFARMRTTAPHFRLAAVEGEPGVGKMLAAQTLHHIGRAAQGAFAPWSAAEFLERAPEIWRALRGGLLYLARVDELSVQQQARLRDFLERAAQERMRTQAPCGPLQMVVGAAQSLRRAAAAGAFRSDLAESLSAIRFPIPPLRERREDIPLLAESFLRRWSAEHGKPLRGFAPEAMHRLTAHLWPGNVRELEIAVSAAALETPSLWIRPIDLPRLDWPAEKLVPPGKFSEEDPSLERAIHRHVTGVLARVHGNKLRAARLLGISRSTLYRMLAGSTAADDPLLAPGEAQHADATAIAHRISPFLK